MKLIITESEREQILNQHKKHGYKKPLNELSGEEIDIIRGKSNEKYSRAAGQFQRDFKKDFLDPSIEYTPHWENDKPMPSGEYTYGDETPPISDKEYESMFTSKHVDKYQEDKEELKKLGKRISSILSHKKEFGGDDMDDILHKLRHQYRVLDNKINNRA